MKTDAARLARCIVAEPLTSQVFAEFGEVVGMPAMNAAGI